MCSSVLPPAGASQQPFPQTVLHLPSAITVWVQDWLPPKSVVIAAQMSLQSAGWPLSGCSLAALAPFTATYTVMDVNDLFLIADLLQRPGMWLLQGNSCARCSAET